VTPLRPIPESLALKVRTIFVIPALTSNGTPKLPWFSAARQWPTPATATIGAHVTHALWLRRQSSAFFGVIRWVAEASRHNFGWSLLISPGLRAAQRPAFSGHQLREQPPFERVWLGL
jgi:hypothetical protein